MAELSGFWTTSGAPAGHQQASYTQAQWSTAARIMNACSGFEGVAPGYLEELAVTYIGVNHCHVNTGGAVVDGKWYINGAAALGVTIPNAAPGTIRLDRIVLQCSWAGFITQVAVLTGTAIAYPALTQTTGVTYEIALYKASVTDAGVVTLTDERTLAAPLIFRQGGHASDWSTVGTTTYFPKTMKMQAGSSQTSNGATVTVTFPVAFANIPLVFVTPLMETAEPHYVQTTPAAANFTIDIFNEADARKIMQFSWLAIGEV